MNRKEAIENLKKHMASLDKRDPEFSKIKAGLERTIQDLKENKNKRWMKMYNNESQFEIVKGETDHQRDYWTDMNAFYKFCKERHGDYQAKTIEEYFDYVMIDVGKIEYVKNNHPELYAILPVLRRQIISRMERMVAEWISIADIGSLSVQQINRAGYLGWRVQGKDIYFRGNTMQKTTRTLSEAREMLIRYDDAIFAMTAIMLERELKEFKTSTSVLWDKVMEGKRPHRTDKGLFYFQKTDHSVKLDNEENLDAWKDKVGNNVKKIATIQIPEQEPVNIKDNLWTDE